MLRGEVWTLLDEIYASKSRPVVVMQSEIGDVFDSIVLCLFTTHEPDSLPLRVKIDPTIENGLKTTSYVMVDKIASADRRELGELIGVLTDTQMHEINRRLVKLLDISSEDID
jgi:mRNA interferase MazF